MKFVLPLHKKTFLQRALPAATATAQAESRAEMFLHVILEVFSVTQGVDKQLFALLLSHLGEASSFWYYTDFAFVFVHRVNLLHHISVEVVLMRASGNFCR